MIVRQRYRRFRPSRTSAGPPPPQGTLPAFSRPLGLDFIITPKGQTVLVELQHGFGRTGLLTLFPLANRIYRKTHWHLRRQRGQHPWLTEQLRRICSDKIKTYKLFGSYQPPSYAYERWSPKVERWLSSLDADYILSKPPRGSCGEGIEVHERLAFLEARGGLLSPMTPLPILLQAFVQPRLLLDDARQTHVGCIRHIVLLSCDGQRLSVVHLPSYWRVSPAPFIDAADKDALTANISRGALPQEVDDGDSDLVRGVAETICTQLLCHILELESIERGERHVISPDGELPASLTAISSRAAAAARAPA
jgi:hypothetical protein